MVCELAVLEQFVSILHPVESLKTVKRLVVDNLCKWCCAVNSAN